MSPRDGLSLSDTELPIEPPVDVHAMAKELGVTARAVRLLVARNQIPCVVIANSQRFFPTQVIRALQQAAAAGVRPQPEPPAPGPAPVRRRRRVVQPVAEASRMRAVPAPDGAS